MVGWSRGEWAPMVSTSPIALPRKRIPVKEHGLGII